MADRAIALDPVKVELVGENDFTVLVLEIYGVGRRNIRPQRGLGGFDRRGLGGAVWSVGAVSIILIVATRPPTRMTPRII